MYQVIITVGDQDARNKALESFAINSNGSIKVAYQKGESEQVVTNYDGAASAAEADLNTSASATKNSDGSKLYTVSNNSSNLYTSNISYRKVIEDYMLPFEFLWAVVVIGDNGSSSGGCSEDLAHAIASMAYDGEIKLIVDDNSSVVTTDEVTGFDLVTYNSYADIRFVRDGHVISSGKDVDSKVSSKHYVSTYTKIETNNSPVLRVKKIESWSAIYDKSPSYETTTNKTPVQQDESVNDTSSWTTESKEAFDDDYFECKVESVKNQFKVAEGDTHEYHLQYNYKIRTRKENTVKTSSQNTVSKSFGNASSVTPDFNDDIADLFNVYSFSAVTGYLTRSNYDSFMEVIEGNSTTANLVDLINYIFNKVTGTLDYGEDLEWKSVWKSSGFSSSGDGNGKVVAADSIQAKVWFSLKDEGYSDEAAAAVMGNIEGESGFNPAIVEGGSGIGFGLCQWSFGRRTQLEDFAKHRGVDPSDEDLQIEFLLAELKPEGGADGYATYQFTGHESDRNTWMTSSDIAETTTAFCAGFERPGNPRNDARITAAKKYYDEFQGATLGSSNGGDGTDESSDIQGIRGYHTSSISGRKYTLYVQDVSGTPWYSIDGCFHNSLGTILSGFGYDKGPNTLSGFSYGSGCFGNRSDFTTLGGCKWETAGYINANDIKKYLQNGEAIFFRVTGGKVTTDNGSAYYSMHWLALLDYKNSGGTDKVYVHDPWKGNPSYGWGDLNNIVKAIVEYVHVWK